MKSLLLSFLLLGTTASMAQSVPEPAPGLHIPDGSRPWALDEFDGKKQLVPIHSSAVQTNNHKGSNVAGGLLAGPFYKSKVSTELQGERAKSVLHANLPVFYVHFNSDADSGESAVGGWAIVHALVDKDRRLLSTVKFTQLTGGAKRNDSQVEVATESLPGGWLKITPKSSLASGEYALEPVMKQENAFSVMVYDFRVDPNGVNAPDAIAASSSDR